MVKKPATVAVFLAATMVAMVSAPAASEPGDRPEVARNSERAAHARTVHRAPRARKVKGEFPLLAPIKALVKLMAPPPQAEPSAWRPAGAAPRRKRTARATAPDNARVSREVVSREVKVAHAEEPVVPSRRVAETHGRTAYDAMIARHAAANGVPPDLVHRIIMRESRYDPRAANKGNYGIMQIRLRTARAMGYKGGAAGLLDADTNMTYAVRYLAGAYRAARGNRDRAMAKYASGYN